MSEIILCENKIVSEKISNFTKSNNSRYKSWELCYNQFNAAKEKDITEQLQEKLSLHLMGYLASWGMYRGSTQLLKEYHYMIHKDLVPILFKNENKRLFDLDPLVQTEELCVRLNIAYKDIEDYYQGLSGGGFKPTKTLVTKILLGVYGCIPAYDTNVYKALKHFGIKSNEFEALIDAVKTNTKFIEQCKDAVKKYPQFTFMKIVDMFLWEIGNENDKKRS